MRLSIGSDTTLQKNGIDKVEYFLWESIDSHPRSYTAKSIDRFVGRPVTNVRRNNEGWVHGSPRKRSLPKSYRLMFFGNYRQSVSRSWKSLYKCLGIILWTSVCFRSNRSSWWLQNSYRNHGIRCMQYSPTINPSIIGVRIVFHFPNSFSMYTARTRVLRDCLRWLQAVSETKRQNCHYSCVSCRQVE